MISHIFKNKSGKNILDSENVIYFDTNIISEVVIHEESWKNIIQFLGKNSLVIGITDAQLIELYDASTVRKKVARFISTIDCILIKSWDEIIYEKQYQGKWFDRVSLNILPYQ